MVESSKYPYLEFIKSQKSSPQKIKQIQAKIEDLIEAGLDKVALLDIIANPPASGDDGAAWTNALGISVTSMETMLPVLWDRLPDCTSAGHWVWSVGSVVGGNEAKRGAGAPIEFRKACENQLLKNDVGTQQRRQEIEKRLSVILSNVSSYGLLPLILLDCRTCGKIHEIEVACNHV